MGNEVSGPKPQPKTPEYEFVGKYAKFLSVPVESNIFRGHRYIRVGNKVEKQSFFTLRPLIFDKVVPLFRRVFMSGGTHINNMVVMKKMMKNFEKITKENFTPEVANDIGDMLGTLSTTVNKYDIQGMKMLNQLRKMYSVDLLNKLNSNPQPNMPPQSPPKDNV